MPRMRPPRSRAPRALTPLVIALGPALCALALTALGYVLFQMQARQAVAGAAGRGATATLSGPLQYTIVLALAGALLALLVTVVGLALYGRERKAARATEQTLAAVAGRAEALDVLAWRVAEHGTQRETAASAWARGQWEAQALLGALDERRATLQRITNDIWAGASNPGSPMDAATAYRLARESAVAGAALGSTLDELRSAMSATRARAGDVEAIDDMLIEDLVTVERMAQETHHSLAVVAGSTGGALKGAAAPAATSDASGRTAARLPALVPDEARVRTQQGRAISPRQPADVAGASGAHPALAWPSSPPSTTSGRLPSAGVEDSPDARPAGPAKRWPFRTEDLDRQERRDVSDSNARGHGPRNPGDSSSRWLND